MDNLTHTLIGAAFAHAARPSHESVPQRRLLVATGVLSANLPDVDLLYFGITPEPLGYLLHHRGHTHTVVGVLAQGLLLAAVFWLVPPLRRLAAGLRGRLFAVGAAGLSSHLLLDAANSYGIHPFHPFDPRWFYGDAVFILEPWLWLLLGIPVAWSALRRVTRVLVLAPLVALPAAMILVGVLTLPPAAALALGGALYAAATRRRAVVPRALAALVASTAFIASLAVLSRHAGEVARAELRPRLRGEIVDVVLNPNPADPACWMAIGVEKDEAAGEYVLHAGTLSLAPRLRPPSACASHRFTSGAAAIAGARSTWSPPRPQPLGRLRELAREDCWTAAWLQFGRAPVLQDGVIADVRFAQGTRRNFTAMRVPANGGASRCPVNVTSWAMPRGDLLGGGVR